MLIGAVFNKESRYVDYVDGSIMYDGTFHDVSKTKIDIMPAGTSETHEDTCIGLDNQGNVKICKGSPDKSIISVCEIGLDETGCYSNEVIQGYITAATKYEHGDTMVSKSNLLWKPLIIPLGIQI